MKKGILLILVLLVIFSSIVITQTINSFCGDGICGENENNRVSCGEYPFGLEQNIKEMCWITSTPGPSCPLDCGNNYDLQPKLFECYEPPTGELCSECGDFVCYGDENRETCPQDCLRRKYQLCGDGICQIGLEDKNICKLEGAVLPHEEYCDMSCYEDCGFIVLNSGQEPPTEPIKIPIEINKNDIITPINLDIGECTGKNLGVNGEVVGLGICLETVNTEGITISIRTRRKDVPLSNENIKKRIVFIKYYTLYNYEVNTKEKHDKYLFPIYNSIINIDKVRNIVSIYTKKIALSIRDRMKS